MATLTFNELTEQALALNTPERVALAQRLWETIGDADLPIYSEEELQKELLDRMHDKDERNWATHEEVMAFARREFGCRK